MNAFVFASRALRIRPALAVWPSLLVSLALWGCGGGGASTIGNATVGTPPTSVLTVSVTGIKTLRLSWTDTEQETGYRLFVQADASAPREPVASLAADTTVHELSVFLPDQVNAHYILQACVAGTCVDAATALVETTLLDGAVGYAVALSDDGHSLIVTAPSEGGAARGLNSPRQDGSAPGAGAAYVFRRQAGTWQQTAYVKAGNTEAGDAFGESAALSGDGQTLAVGAIGESSGATGIGGDPTDNSSPGSGAVYLY